MKKKTCKRGYFFARCLRVYYVESQEMVAVKIKLHFFFFSGTDTFQELTLREKIKPNNHFKNASSVLRASA